ncbi:hypothetical protein PV326_002971 [Microctonus aethiopoides]|nr:hypothetical protein PV326_002971 [Microctonus aethiopoides]
MRKRVGRETNESDREKEENEETKPYEGKYSVSWRVESTMETSTKPFHVSWIHALLLLPIRVKSHLHIDTNRRHMTVDKTTIRFEAVMSSNYQLKEEIPDVTCLRCRKRRYTVRVNELDNLEGEFEYF